MVPRRKWVAAVGVLLQLVLAFVDERRGRRRTVPVDAGDAAGLTDKLWKLEDLFDAVMVD